MALLTFYVALSIRPLSMGFVSGIAKRPSVVSIGLIPLAGTGGAATGARTDALRTGGGATADGWTALETGGADLLVSAALFRGALPSFTAKAARCRTRSAEVK